MLIILLILFPTILKNYPFIDTLPLFRRKKIKYVQSENTFMLERHTRQIGIEEPRGKIYGNHKIKREMKISKTVGNSQSNWLK